MKMGIPEFCSFGVSLFRLFAFPEQRKKVVIINCGCEPTNKRSIDAMKNMDVEMTAEERKLLSVRYKNRVDSWRESWDILSLMQHKEVYRGNEQAVKLIPECRKKLESEISDNCNNIMTLIDERLIPSSTSAESTVFFYKMKGDYYRYLAEFKTGEDKEELSHLSLKAYQMATTTAEAELPINHPIRLGLALNLTVLYSDIMNSPERACKLSKQVFDAAINEIHSLNMDDFIDAISVLELMNGNIIKWTADIPEDAEEAQTGDAANEVDVDEDACSETSSDEPNEVNPLNECGFTGGR